MNYRESILLKFIDILPFEDSFFFKKSFKKKVKLSNELIRLNYKKYSPYKNPFFTSIIEDKNLYIWFYERKFDSKIIIPEAYLFFNFFKEKNQNSFILIEGYNVFFTLIIKNGILVNTYVSNDKNENLIAIEMNNYRIYSYKEIEKKDYIRQRKELIENIEFQELYKWSNFDFDKEKFLPKLINSIAYPLSFFLVFKMGLEIYHMKSIEKKLDKVEAKYTKIKIKTDDIREQINIENNKIEKWKNFVATELPYGDIVSTFVNISKAFKEEKFIFISFSILGSRVKIDMESNEDFIKGLNILSKIKNLKDITIKYNNRNKNKVAYEATIVSQGVLP